MTGGGSQVTGPQDDASIADGVELWRRIPIEEWKADESRPSSMAFDNPELSVVIASECTGGMATLLQGHERYGVASLTAGQARVLGWGIIRVPDPDLPGHAHLTGKKTKGQLRRMAKGCLMLKPPEE